MTEVAALCKKHNILFIVDEVQAGLGRAGANLCHLREDVRPDLVILGKALSGGLHSYMPKKVKYLLTRTGMYALSGVMGDTSVMGVIDPYECVFAFHTLSASFPFKLTADKL